MIPVLVKANAMDFATDGIGVLADCISCEVTEERNGSYELVLQYPVTGRNYGAVSYTHLDVYKRQEVSLPQEGGLGDE